MSIDERAQIWVKGVYDNAICLRRNYQNRRTYGLEMVHCQPSIIGLWAFLETSKPASRKSSIISACRLSTNEAAKLWLLTVPREVSSDIFQPYALPMAEERRSMQGTPRGSSSSRAQVLVRGGA